MHIGSGPRGERPFGGTNPCKSSNLHAPYRRMEASPRRFPKCNALGIVEASISHSTGIGYFTGRVEQRGLSGAVRPDARGSRSWEVCAVIFKDARDGGGTT